MIIRVSAVLRRTVWGDFGCSPSQSEYHNLRILMTEKDFYRRGSKIPSKLKAI